MERDKHRDEVPEDFDSVAAAAEFWDSHDIGEYWDLTREAEVDVDIERQVFLAALEPSLAKKISAYAHGQGVSAETLVNLWLNEKLSAVTSGR